MRHGVKIDASGAPVGSTVPQSQKLTLILPDLRGGGAERVCVELAHQFVRAGHDVELAVMRAEGELLGKAQGLCTVTDLQVPLVRQLPVALARHLRARRPDGILAAIWPLTVVAPLSATLSGHKCKVVVSEHGILSEQYSGWGHFHRQILRFTTRAGYRLADHRVAVSKGLAKDMAKLSSMPLSKFRVIGNPISKYREPTAERIAEADARWAAPRGARILTVGNLKAVKNHSLLIRAFARLRHRNKRLMLLGKGKEKRQLQDLARQIGVADKVIFAGFESDPTPFYATSDVFVLSSDSEGFGNVLVEALSSGTPVVSTDCPSGPREILDNGRYGQLTPVGDPVALAQAISETLAAPTSPALLKQRAAEFAPKTAAKAYLELLGG